MRSGRRCSAAERAQASATSGCSGPCWAHGANWRRWCRLRPRRARAADAPASDSRHCAPAIAGVALRQPCHERVADHLRHNRGGTDLRHDGVATDHATARQLQGGCPVAVDQDQAGSHAQPRHRPAHSEHRGAQNVEPLDLGDGRGREAHHGMGVDQGRQLTTPLGGEALGVGNAGDRPQQHHSCRHHRTCERATADLVDTGRRAVHGRAAHVGQPGTDAQARRPRPIFHPVTSPHSDRHRCRRRPPRSRRGGG